MKIFHNSVKIILFFSIIYLFSGNALASRCFVAKEKEIFFHNDGDCDKRYAPCSTFKIALSLIGYDQGILIDEINPLWHFKEGYADFLDVWKEDQTPQTWIKNSCVWYSQILTKKLGITKFQDYVTKFSYGNMNISGDKGENNGLTNSWLSSSLEISSLEQIVFLEKFLTDRLYVSKHATQMTKNILFVEDLKNGWKLYGKTGNGRVIDFNGKKTDLQHGWFIGWIEKEGRKVIFSNHITDQEKEESFASFRAKNDAKEKLMKIISNIKDSK